MRLFLLTLTLCLASNFAIAKGPPLKLQSEKPKMGELRKAVGHPLQGEVEQEGRITAAPSLTTETAAPGHSETTPNLSASGSSPASVAASASLSAGKWTEALGIWQRGKWQYKLLEQNNNVVMAFYKIPDDVSHDGAVRSGENWIVAGKGSGNDIAATILDKAWNRDNVKPPVHPVKCTIHFDQDADTLEIKATLLWYKPGHKGGASGHWVPSVPYDVDYKLTRVK
jgi:hypothetical protein